MRQLFTSISGSKDQNVEKERWDKSHYIVLYFQHFTYVFWKQPTNNNTTTTTTPKPILFHPLNFLRSTCFRTTSRKDNTLQAKKKKKHLNTFGATSRYTYIIMTIIIRCLHWEKCYERGTEPLTYSLSAGVAVTFREVLKSVYMWSVVFDIFTGDFKVVQRDRRQQYKVTKATAIPQVSIKYIWNTFDLLIWVDKEDRKLEWSHWFHFQTFTSGSITWKGSWNPEHISLD